MRLDAINALALAVALGLAAWGGQLGTGRGTRRVDYYPRLSSDVAPVTLADGSQVLVDAGGESIPLVHYTRIVSGSLIADRVLADLCEPDRILAFTAFSSGNSPSAHRYVGKPRLTARAPIEDVLKLQPQILIVNNVVDPGRVARLRDHGVLVFDLGHMRGLPSLLANIRAIGWLIGAPQRAEAYARALERRMSHVARDVARKPPTALYLNVYADRLYGGADETSYHYVIVGAGLRDAAAAAGLDGWPELTPERVLSLNPDYLVTKRGVGEVLCGRPALSLLRACKLPHRVLEVDGMLLDDPGPSMLDAAEQLRDAYERAVDADRR